MQRLVMRMQATMHPARKGRGNRDPVVKGMPPATENHNAPETRAASSRRQAANALPARRVRAANAEEATAVRAMGAKVLPTVNGG